MAENLAALLGQRFGVSPDVPPELARLEELVHAAGHRSHRAFTDDPIPPAWTETLLACALSAPSKSDLQQSCVVRVEDNSKRAALAALVPTLDWLPSAPLLLVFCGDSRRIRRICELRGRTFGNDHLDAMFNASVDAALVIMNFIRVARAAGLGCCPISLVRNRAAELSDLLELPGGVFPVAGMAARPGGPCPRTSRNFPRYRNAACRAALPRVSAEPRFDAGRSAGQSSRNPCSRRYRPKSARCGCETWRALSSDQP